MSTAYDQTPQKGWWGRNWIWVVPVGCVTPILLCGGGIVSIALFVFGTLKTSDVYQQALSRATASEEVKKRLGEPVTAGFWVAGAIQISDAAGNADLVIPISGPKGSAVLQAAATKANGKWDFSKLELLAEGATGPINLLPKADVPKIDKPKVDKGATKAAPKASP
jgi:Cytochrome oxidase complex assembly protein 1